MDIAHIRDLTHTHCRFKLRSGKEVFGVIWEVATSPQHADDAEGQFFFFASVRDYERLQSDPQQPIGVIPMRAEEIVLAERLAS
jgi:hypothetical protein